MNQPSQTLRPTPPQSQPASAVRCRGLVKEYGDGEAPTVALRGIDLDLPCGEMTLIVGPSGCGKTTLISVLAGLLEPTRGEVEVFGVALGRLSASGLARHRARNVGFVFQQYNLLPAMTAAENVAVPLLIAGRERGTVLVQAAGLLERLGLGGRAGARPAQLSGGQQQRVAIARALIHEPRLLVCDEPTAALDSESGRAVMELIRQVAVRPGRAVLVVTHDDRVLRFGDRLIRMSDGRVRAVQARGESLVSRPPSIDGLGRTAFLSRLLEKDGSGEPSYLSKED